MRGSRTARAVAITSLAAAGLVFGGAAPADATITSCTDTFTATDRGFNDVYCKGTEPSAFRAWISCTDGLTHYGPWEFAGDFVDSTAQCPLNRFWTNYGYQIHP
jgi:hypothetical protein